MCMRRLRRRQQRPQKGPVQHAQRHVRAKGAGSHVAALLGHTSIVLRQAHREGSAVSRGAGSCGRRKGAHPGVGGGAARGGSLGQGTRRFFRPLSSPQRTLRADDERQDDKERRPFHSCRHGEPDRWGQRLVARARAEMAAAFLLLLFLLLWVSWQSLLLADAHITQRNQPVSVSPALFCPPNVQPTLQRPQPNRPTEPPSICPSSNEHLR